MPFLLRTKSVSGQVDHGFADPGLASIQSRRLPICASKRKCGRPKERRCVFKLPKVAISCNANHIGTFKSNLDSGYLVLKSWLLGCNYFNNLMNQAVAIVAKRDAKRLSKYAPLRRLVMFKSATIFACTRTCTYRFHCS